MKKEWLMASVLSIITLSALLAILRSFAPALLGIPVDLQMVKVDEKVPPFYENVFRLEDFKSQEFIIKDPLAVVRARPLVPNQKMVGPNDILGFRNHSVPNVADVIVIGDSQTYGNNSQIQLNWPGQMSTALNRRQTTTIYNMSVGGWGGVQYLYAASKAIAFQPRVIVVAFYTGNDPLESFRVAYSYDAWKKLIPDPSLSASDIPKVVFPAPESELWKVSLGGGHSTVFTPKLRYSSNMNHPAVRAGYAVMAGSAREIGRIANQAGVQVVFTIIPTKELVYERKILSEDIIPQQDYLALVAAEKANIAKLKSVILNLEGATYIDLLDPLQEAAMEPGNLYPSNKDGHPLAQGYGIIAATVAKSVEKFLPMRIRGFAVLELGSGNYKPILINREGYWYFAGKADKTLIEKNGWNVSNAPVINLREIADLEYAGEISDVQPERFGPQSL